MKSSKRNKSTKIENPPVQQGPKLWQWALGLFVALFIALEIYGPAIGGPFLYDDRYLPFMAPGIESVPLKAWLLGMRPFLMLTFWINFQFSGQNPYSYHVVNVLIHFVDAVLVALIVRKILSWSKIKSDLAIVLSLFAGGLFLLHPLQTESVTYVASRSDSLSVLLFNTAFAVFVYRRRTAASWPAAIGVLALFGLAVLTKEHTAVLPALLLLTDYFWNPGFSFEGFRKNWRLYAPISAGAVLGLIFVWRVLSSAKSAGFHIKDLTWYQYFFTQCRAIWVYIRLFFLPVGQNVDWDFPISHSILNHGAIFALAGLVALAAAAWIYRRRCPLASYGYFTFLLLLAPTSSVVPIADVLVEHRTYMPFLGLLLVVMEPLSRWKISRTALATTLAVVLFLSAALTYQRNQVWSSSLALWSDSVQKSPRKARPRFQLAFAYFEQHRCDEAVTEYAEAARLEKPTYDLLVDWAEAADCAGNHEEAIKKLREAASIERSAHVWAQIGMVYGEQGKEAESLDALAQASAIDPNYEMTYLYRGNVFATSQQYDKAAAEYRHALEINPADQQARDSLNMVIRHLKR